MLKRHFPVSAIALLAVVASTISAQEAKEYPVHRAVLARLMETGLGDRNAMRLLEELVRRAPLRLSGSAGADSAVKATFEMMQRLGCDSVWTEPVMVPHWVRGSVENAVVIPFRDRRASISLSVAALGGSVATPTAGIAAEVVEVTSLADARALGPRAKGKIVFYNRPMDPTTRSTFAAYGDAVDQRSRGAIEAARVGAVAVLVRSMTIALDDVPHTGTLSYSDSIKKIPAAAISTKGAESLSRLLQRGPKTRVRLTLDCKTLPDALSANVVGEIRGSERPDEIIVVGGHLDAWDKGHGAHDDGSGCVHAIEVLSLFKRAGIIPKRTVRAVMFMNEENGSRGGPAYASNPARQREKTIAAIESDRGGFTPRGFTMSGDSARRAAVLRWSHLFDALGTSRFIDGGTGVDVDPIVKRGAMGFGLDVDDQRYFDYHHSANDTIDKVHWRELEFGAIATAFLCYLISEEGL